jgi:hypothetical protein
VTDFKHGEQVSRQRAAEHLVDIAYALAAGEALELRAHGTAVKVPGVTRPPLCAFTAGSAPRWHDLQDAEERRQSVTQSPSRMDCERQEHRRAEYGRAYGAGPITQNM